MHFQRVWESLTQCACGGQRTTLQRWFPSFHLFLGSGMELWSPGLCGKCHLTNPIVSSYAAKKVSPVSIFLWVLMWMAIVCFNITIDNSIKKDLCVVFQSILHVVRSIKTNSRMCSSLSTPKKPCTQLWPATLHSLLPPRLCHGPLFLSLGISCSGWFYFMWTVSLTSSI